MNKNNKITLTGATGKPVLTYKIFYWDYSTSVQGKKTLLYVGKAYNFNNASTIDIYVNDIIKNIPRTSGFYNIKVMPSGFDVLPLNLYAKLEVVYGTANTTFTQMIYLDNTKSYYDEQLLDAGTPGEVVYLDNKFNTINKLHNDTFRQLAFTIWGTFDDIDKVIGIKYNYTDNTSATLSLGMFKYANTMVVLFTFTENYLFDNNPQPSKTIKSLDFVYDVTGIEETQVVNIFKLTNESCEHNVLSFENRNGSISYLQLKGNTIYSESIQRYMKIDMFDKETVFASLVDETITINTGWLTDAEAKALEDLYVSKKIYLFDATLGKYLAVNLDESEYKQRQFKNERNLKNYTIKLKLQQKEVL